MTQCISIGTAYQKDLLKDNLCRELWALKDKGVAVRLEESPAGGGLTFLACSISGTGQVEPVFRRQIAGVITDLIISKWEDKLLKDIIRTQYYYFDDDEKCTIYEYAQQKLNLNAKNKEKNKLCILNRLTEYLTSNNDIVIDGFVRFRLKEYVNSLYDVADEAVDDFLSEREYNEFIQLLRYFVEIQEPRVNLINVVLCCDGVFKLYDEKGEVINSDYLHDFMMDLTDNEINYEDLLISALITIAPGHIKIHPGDGKLLAGTMDTINKVFAGRVSRCEGCPLCSGSSN